METLSANFVFGIAWKPIVNSQAITFVILFMACLVIGILPLIMFTFFFLRKNARNIKKRKQNKTPCFLFKMWIQDGTQHILC